MVSGAWRFAVVSGRVAWSTASKRKQERRRSSGPMDYRAIRRGAGPQGAGRAGAEEDRRARHRISLSAIHLGHRPHLGKGIPADHWESVAEKGFQLVYGATMNLFVNRRGEYLGYGPEAAELVGIPEPETFMQLPWDKRVARHVLHAVPQPRGARRPGGVPHRRLRAAISAACTTSSRRIMACSCATAPSRR